MPYILKERRPAIDAAMDGALLTSIDSPGDLNYAISRLVHQYALTKNGPVCYNSLNALMGVFECAKLEFYRTVVAPYEDTKIEANGPVSELDGS